MSARRVLRRVLACQYLACCLAWAQSPPDTEPRALSIYPSAAQRGQVVKAQIRGKQLDGARAVWTSAAAGLSTRVTAVEQPDASAPFQVSVEIAVDAAAQLGTYSLRTVSSRGISNAIRFEVLDRAVTLETESGHAEPAHAQSVAPPCVVNGRLSKPGEADLFAFQANEGDKLTVHVTTAENFEPRVALFSRKTSWFDGARPVRLLFDEERSQDLMAAQARGTFRAAEPGQYFVEVSSLFGKGCGECTYQLSLSPTSAGGSGSPARRNSSGSEPWRERGFARPLGPEWIAAVNERAAATTQPEPLTTYSDRNKPTGPLNLPALISGTIGKPGEADAFHFQTQAGDKLAFEIETPQTGPPHFNPVLAVLDSQGRQVFSNLQRRVSLFNNNAEVEGYLKDIEAKAIHTFQAGAYTLKIRDVTARYGGEHFAYRIVVRRQTPHVGEVTSAEIDHVNLAPGASRKAVVTAALEEGFTGDVAFSATGLPKGVSMLAAGRVVEERAPLDLPENAETVLPAVYSSALIFAAAPDAELTAEPARVVLHFRPIVNARPGPEALVREFPLMVVAASGEQKQK